MGFAGLFLIRLFHSKSSSTPLNCFEDANQLGQSWRTQGSAVVTTVKQEHDHNLNCQMKKRIPKNAVKREKSWIL